MNQLVKELIRPLLEDNRRVTAVYGGGFKPPIKGHFNLVKKALKEFPEIDEFIIYVGGGVRDGITQEASLAIWDIYTEVLGPKVKIVPSSQPIRDVLRYAKDHPTEEVYFVIGYREGRQDDLQDIASRTKDVEEKYPNLEVKVISTPDPEISGTNARKSASKGDKEKFMTFLPTEIPPGEKEEIYNIVDKAILKEHMAHTNTIDIVEKCAQLSNHMIQKGYKITPLPGLKVIDSDVDNSQDFFGKTAYYDPNEQLIVLYTQGRHPKDIVRSYAHEMIHHIQNIEDRLGNIVTTNTTEDDHLEDIEREAYEEGNIAFRNWTDSLQEGKGGADTSWTGADNETITLQDILELTKDIKIVNLPTEKLAPIVLNWDDNPEEIERISQVKISTQYPILVMVDEQNKIQWILDGNHRAQKALRAKTKTIPTKLIKPSNLNSKARKILLGIIDEANLKGTMTFRNWADSLQEKKNKDPFGLNAFAYELARLGEETLNEGRYDKFTNELSRLAFELIKDGYDVGRKVVDETFSVGPADEDPDIVSNDFEFDFNVQATYTDDTYTVDGGANAGYDDEGDEITPLLTVRFEIPKNIDWQRVSFDIKDVIRHELEHLTQSGLNVRPGKQMDDDQFIRDMIDADFLPKSDYFKLEKEVDAMLQGLYLKAKKSRRPFKDVIASYLSTQPLSTEDKESILNLWRKRNKALALPLFEETEEKKLLKKPVIFCDMDGVLVNFDEGYKQLTGMSTHHTDAQGKKEFWKAFRQGLKDKNISEESYWANLDWQPGGKELWDYISQYKPYVLTAPAVNFDFPEELRYDRDVNESILGKLDWVKRLPNMRKIYFAAAKNKAKFAGPNNILIDDRKDTIDAWNAKGGIGILHTTAASTIAQLKELGL